MIKFEQKGPAERNHLPDDPWEDAYLRFETPEQEIRKFIGRLKFMDAMKWRRNAKIVELFCGRGSGLRALHQLGFNQVEGIDLSPSLAAEYAGPGKVLVGDCRQLPFESASKDILIVQGGLHHLPVLPDDLDRVLAEGARVLRENGLLLLIEPWVTLFLSMTHAALSEPNHQKAVTKDRCVGNHDSLRTANIRKLVKPSGTHLGFARQTLPTRALSFQVGKNLLRRT